MIIMVHPQVHQMQQLIIIDIKQIYQKMGIFSAELQTSPVCPADTGINNKHHWCTYQAVDEQTSILDIVYLFFICFISVILVRFYQILIRYHNQNRYRSYFGGIFKTIYLILACWCICSLAKVILNLVVYYMYMSPDFDNNAPSVDSDPELGSFIVVSSTIYTVFQFSCAFILNLLTIIIPYQWLKVMLHSVNENILVTFELKNKMQNYLKILKLIKIYIKYIRFGFLIILFSQPFIFYIPQIRCKMSYVNTCCIFGESIIIVAFYLFVVHVSKYIKASEIVKVESSDELKIKFQYAIFFVVSLVRVFWNIQTVITIFEELRYQPNGNCSNMSLDNTYLIVILVLHHGVIHLIPVLLTLYLYRPSVLKLRKYDQLLDIDEVESNMEGKQNYKQIVRQFYQSDLIDQNMKGVQKSKIQFS